MVADSGRVIRSKSFIDSELRGGGVTATLRGGWNLTELGGSSNELRGSNLPNPLAIRALYPPQQDEGNQDRIPWLDPWDHRLMAHWIATPDNFFAIAYSRKCTKRCSMSQGHDTPVCPGLRRISWDSVQSLSLPMHHRHARPNKTVKDHCSLLFMGVCTINSCTNKGKNQNVDQRWKWIVGHVGHGSTLCHGLRKMTHFHHWCRPNKLNNVYL